MTCPTCDEQNREVTRLRQDLANRDAELRDLRLREREQTKALQASARQLTRAKAKLRRQASQADAASTIAEVEVALESLRSAPGAPIRAIAVPRAILESAAVPFAHGDYGVAMDRAAQAEQLIAMLADPAARNHAARTAAEVPFDVAVSLRVARDGNLRRQPRGNSPVQHVLLQGSTVVAHAYKGNWLRVETASGRWGWLYLTLVGAP